MVGDVEILVAKVTEDKEKEGRRERCELLLYVYIYSYVFLKGAGEDLHQTGGSMYRG